MLLLAMHTFKRGYSSRHTVCVRGAGDPLGRFRDPGTWPAHAAAPAGTCMRCDVPVPVQALMTQIATPCQFWQPSQRRAAPDLATRTALAAAARTRSLCGACFFFLRWQVMTER